ncbi:MAG: Gfo/Idh/MocA family oxidoreductase [Oscillospiraceae bacterium]|nr:Gfo/Idh/MocA family oxidoreductase [Oscillospiraceae bacterium]
MKYATIGTSWITEAFIESTSLVDDLELCAVYSRSFEKAEAFRQKHSAALAFDSLDALAACPDISAVYIGTPNSLHYEQSKKMLEAGKHVICEKPIVVNPEEVRELIDLARAKGLVYMEAIMFLHSPAHRALLAALPKIGRITTAHLAFSQLSSKYPRVLAGEHPNIFNPKLCAGCLMDIGVYNVYTAIALFGYPKEIRSAAGFLETGADAYGTSIFMYDDKQITLTYSKVGQHYAPSEIYGDRGTLQIDTLSLFNGLRICYSDGTTQQIFGEESRQTIMAVEAQRLYNYVNQPETHKDEYYAAQELALAVSRAMKEIRRQNPLFAF